MPLAVDGMPHTAGSAAVKKNRFGMNNLAVLLARRNHMDEARTLFRAAAVQVHTVCFQHCACSRRSVAENGFTAALAPSDSQGVV